MSTLHVIETATRKLLPDTIARTRAASLAWKPDDSGFYYTRYPKPGDVAAGQEMYNRHVFYHPLGGDPAKDPLIFGEGRDPQDWPNVALSNDGRWLSIMVEQGWTKNEVFLKDVHDELGAAAHHHRQRISLLRAALQWRSLHPDQRRRAALSRLQDSGHDAHARALARDHSAIRRRADLAAHHRRPALRPLRTERALAAEAL